MTHVPYSTSTVNSQPNHVQTVKSQLNSVKFVNSTTLPIHNVTSQPITTTPCPNNLPNNYLIPCNPFSSTGIEEYAEDLQADLAEAIDSPEEVGAACLAPGQFWATDGSLGNGDAGTVIEILEIQDQGQLRVRKWSLLSMDQTWPKTSDTISWYPPDDNQGFPPTSCTRTTKPKHLKQSRKVQPILQVWPRSILKSATLGSPKRRSVYFALLHNTVNGVSASIPPRVKVSCRSLIYNSSLASEQLHHRTNRPVSPEPFRGKGPDCTEELGSRMTAETNA